MGLCHPVSGLWCESHTAVLMEFGFANGHYELGNMNESYLVCGVCTHGNMSGIGRCKWSYEWDDMNES